MKKVPTCYKLDKKCIAVCNVKYDYEVKGINLVEVVLVVVVVLMGFIGDIFVSSVKQINEMRKKS